MMQRVMLVTTVLATLAACGGDGTGKAVTTRDSSGVAIVEYDSTALGAAPLFVGGAPIYTMTAEGDSLHNAAAIRSAVLVGNGRFVALDSRANRLVLFDSTGAVGGTYGGRARTAPPMNAPGGLRLLASGALQVVDFPARVLQFDTGTLTLSGESTIGPETPVIAVLLHQTAPGSGIAVATEADSSGGKSVQYLLRIARTKVDTLTTWPGGDPAEFGRQAIARAWGDRIVTSGSDWSFLVRDSLGAVRQIVRVAGTPRPVTQAMRDSVLARQRRMIEALPVDQEVKADAMKALDQKVFAQTLPAFDDILEARDGSLWVGEYTLAGDADRHYAVFGADGTLTRRVRLPATSRVLSVDGDLVLVRSGDGQSGRLELIRLGAAPAAPAS